MEKYDFDRSKIRDFLSLNENVFGKFENFESKEIGGGENNLNFLVTLDETKKFVFRFSKTGALVDRLEHEYEFLKLLPNGVAPQALLFDNSGKFFDTPILVESFVHGVHPDKWSDDDLKKFAKILSDIHSIKKPYVRIDVYEYFEKLNEYLFNDKPELRKDAELTLYISQFETYSQKNDHLFEDLDYLSLIHSDLASSNILSNEGNFTVIDWELAKYNDNAKDFSTFFYDDCDLNSGKWRIELSGERQKILFSEYKKYFPDPTLEDRVAVWLTFDKLCSLIYLKWKKLSYKNDVIDKTISDEDVNTDIYALSASLHKTLG